MTLGDITTYYIGLLTIQITGLTLISAGIIALYQIHDKQVPKRDFTAVVNKNLMINYFVTALALIIVTAFFAWSVAEPHNIVSGVNFHLNSVSLSSISTAIILILTLAMYGVFFYLLLQSRSLLDTKSYLDKLSKKFQPQQLSDYLFHTYSTKPYPYIQSMFVSIGIKKVSKKKEAEEKKKAKDRINDWNTRYKSTESTTNPLSPFVDYCRSNVVDNAGDVETIGLPILENLMIAFADKYQEESHLLASYLEDITNDLKESFSSSSLAVRKKYIDLLVDLSTNYCKSKHFKKMLNIASKIFIFVKGSSSEELKMYAVSKLRELTDCYCEVDKNQKDWRKFDGNLEELALIVARITEDHFHNIRELSPVSIIENNRTELEDIGSEIANYFAAYEDLHRKYPSIIPVIFFDAVDVSAEAIGGAINRSTVIKENIGLSKSRYEQTVDTLYFIFYSYAKAAIENNNPDLLKDSVYRLTRGLEFTHNKSITSCAVDLTDLLVSLGIRIACSDELKDETSYGGERLTDKIAECVNDYADRDKLDERQSSIEHDLFTIIYSNEARAFKALIGWS